MNNQSLQERVAMLEKQMASLLAQPTNLEKQKDWRRTVGIFTNDPDMQELFADAQKIREADRQKARRRYSPKRRGSR